MRLFTKNVLKIRVQIILINWFRLIKKKLIFCILTTLCLSVQSQYSLIPTGTSGTLSDISIFNKNILINSKDNFLAKGYNECNALISLVAPGIIGSSNYLSRTDTNIFYVLSVNQGSSSITKSTDGGYNWIQKTTTNYGASGIAFFDTLEGIFFNSTYQLNRTKNGGNSWTTNNSPLSVVTAIESFGDSTVIIGGISTTNPTFYKSKDRGNSWQFMGGFGSPSYPRSIFFINKDTIFVSSSNTLFGSYLSKTTNGGNQWLYSVILPNTDYDLNGIYFKNSLEGYIVGKTYADSLGVVLKTKNGGQTWEINKTPFKSNLQVIKLLNDSTFLISGSNGLLLKMSYKKAVYTGLGEQQKTLEGLSFYPNPVVDKLMIKYDEIHRGKLSTKIFNSLGQLIWKVELTAEKVEIDLSNIPSGVYFIHFQNEGRQSVRKFIRE